MKSRPTDQYAPDSGAGPDGLLHEHLMDPERKQLQDRCGELRGRVMAHLATVGRILEKVAVDPGLAEVGRCSEMLAEVRRALDELKEVQRLLVNLHVQRTLLGMVEGSRQADVTPELLMVLRFYPMDRLR